MAFTPRPKQQEVLAYRSGKMGVSAVPGSGKTWTLSRLAADIIASGQLEDDQEVLVVTLVNSAVDHFYQRVSHFLEEDALLNLGYRVRTLHGLAHDIVRERPDLVGLADNFQIVDERAANGILASACEAWLHSHPGALQDYLNPDLDAGKAEWVQRQHLPELAQNMALNAIRYAKDWQLTPERLRERLDRLPAPLPLSEMACDIYSDYQRALAYRGAVDFDDLIRLALEALTWDEKLLLRLRRRWPFILEDEAQDSSRLQEEILSALAGVQGNWVRVGDPNQAIYETFTTADPEYLRAFIRSRNVQARQLPNSGRSTQSIMDLANALVEWTQSEHPTPEARAALQGPPFIEAVPPGSAGENPPDDPGGVFLALNKFTPDEEIAAIVASLARWLPDHPESTVAVLAPRNQRGFELVDALQQRKIEVVDSLLRSSASTRLSAEALSSLLRFLANPAASSKLAELFKAWAQSTLPPGEGRVRLERAAERLRKCRQVEDYLWPTPERDWLPQQDLEESDPAVYALLLEFRTLARRWQEAILLPVDQVLLTASQDLFTEASRLALAHKLAVLIRHASAMHPAWQLPDLTKELEEIASNERRFLGFSQDDTGFDPTAYKGKVVVATMHKAKGLEWDRVYLMSVNNYDFPSGMAYDTYMPERWFLRDHLNLEAEALAQLDAALSNDPYQWYQEGQASLAARLDYVRERLRLFYVGVTRARTELVVTWNTGRRGGLQPAQPLLALHAYWNRLHPKSPPDTP
ncbi:MAG: ATP-dependent helicase [Chloroflexi bacterium]|nr:ATP-dependent helicase [Chloroflexota bacterium]